MNHVPASVLRILALGREAFAGIFAMARRPPPDDDPGAAKRLALKQSIVGRGNDPTQSTCSTDILCAHGLISATHRDAAFAYLRVKASALGQHANPRLLKAVPTGQEITHAATPSGKGPLTITTTSQKWAAEDTRGTVWEEKLYVPQSGAAFASENKRRRWKPHRVGDLGKYTDMRRKLFLGAEPISGTTPGIWHRGDKEPTPRQIEIEEDINKQAKACHASLKELARELGRPTHQILNIVDNVVVYGKFPDEAELPLLRRGLDRLAMVLGVAVDGREGTAAQEAPGYRRKAASHLGNAAKTSRKQQRRKLVEDILRCRPAGESPISADEVRGKLLAHGFDVSPVTIWRDIGAVRRRARR